MELSIDGDGSLGVSSHIWPRPEVLPALQLFLAASLCLHELTPWHEVSEALSEAP